MESKFIIFRESIINEDFIFSLFLFLIGHLSIVVVSAETLDLKHRQRPTREAGTATTPEAPKHLLENHCVGHDNVFELVLKGFGPGRNGPHRDAIGAKIDRIIDATRRAVGSTKVTNKRKR